MELVFITHLLRKLKGTQSLTVLSLHRISPERDLVWQPIHPKMFEQILKYVHRHYEVVCFSDLKDIRKIKKPLLILSFDDGYHDFIEYALPLLKQFNFRCNHNLVVSCLDNNTIIWTQRLNHLFNHLILKKTSTSLQLGQEILSVDNFKNNWFLFYKYIYSHLLQSGMNLINAFLQLQEERFALTPSYKMINWEAARTIQNEGVEIGCHTYNHIAFNKNTTEEEFFLETLAAKTKLEENLNCRIELLSLPNGLVIPRIETIENDFSFILTVKDQVTRFPHSSLKYIPRINIVNESMTRATLRIELLQNYIWHP